MDTETYRQLRQVGMSIPKELLHKAIKKDAPLKGQVKEYLDWSKKRPEHMRDRRKEHEIRTHYDKGAFDHESTKIDPHTAAKIEKHVDGHVRHLIDSGKIKKSVPDAWEKRIRDKTKK